METYPIRRNTMLKKIIENSILVTIATAIVSLDYVLMHQVLHVF